MGKHLASVDVTVAIGGNCTLLLYSSGDMILAVTSMKQLLLLFDGGTFALHSGRNSNHR